MRHLALTPVDAKTLRLTGIDPVLADCLFDLPQPLEHRDRLYPDPFPGNAPANEEWHRLMDDDLRHLFAAAGETVARDLTGLQPDLAHRSCRQLLLPVAHLNAWLSALNQARLILAEQHAVTEADMRLTDLDPRRAKDLALYKIHLLGYLLQLLVDHAGGAAA